MQRLSQAVEWIAAELRGEDRAVTGASIDTRSLQPGHLFVALPGSRVDGHDFVRKAAALGASGALVSQPQDFDFPQLVVPDVLAALQAIATHWRRLWAELSDGVLAGVTGSNGKTSVKTLLAQMLSQQFSVFATPGNLNNHIGVPLCMLNLRPEHDRAVIEMGASAAGEIAQLSAIAQPHVGVVTNAADAHLLGFGSRDGVAQAKGEIYAGLAKTGTAIINADDAYCAQWQARAGQRPQCLFGRASNADVRAVDEVNGSEAQQFNLQLAGESLPISLPLPGRHSVMNALAAAAAANVMGVATVNIAAALNHAASVGGRLQTERLSSGALLINDAYNANPASLAAAIEVLAGLPGPRYLVLGDMAELGDGAVAAHQQAGRSARESGIEQLWACGPLSAHAAEQFGAEGRHFSDVYVLGQQLAASVTKGASVLVKGSRSAGMERVVNMLKDAF